MSTSVSNPGSPRRKSRGLLWLVLGLVVLVAVVVFGILGMCYWEIFGKF